MGRVIRFVLPFVLLAAGIFIFLELRSSGPEDEAATRSERSWPVEAVSVALKDLRPTLRLFGRIESPRESHLRSALNADVLTSSIRVGDAVKKGQTLLQLDDTDSKLTLAQRAAELAEIEAQIKGEKNRFKNDQALYLQDKKLLTLAKTKLKRAEQLAESQSGSQASVDTALEAVARQTLNLTIRQNAIDDHPIRLAQLRARLKRVSALRDHALRNLERTTILAPFDGRITAVHISPGDRAQMGSLLIDLFETASTEVRAQIPNRYLAQLRRSLNQGKQVPAIATIDGREIVIELNRLAGKIESGEGGVDGFFNLPRTEGNLELGRTLAVLLTLPAETNVLALPATAVYGANSAYKIEAGRLERVQLERVGEYRNGEWGTWSLFRSSDLSDKDQVLTSQLPNAIEGLRVDVVSNRN